MDAADERLRDAVASDELDEQKMFNETAAEFASRYLDDGLRDAAKAMVDICVRAEDERLRFAAAKYLLDRGFGSISPTTGKYAGDDDPLFKFIAKVVKEG